MTAGAQSYICVICGWIYDPAKGDPDSGIAPGTAWEDIPDDWVCPVCGVGKGDFEPIDNPTPAPTTSPEPAPASRAPQSAAPAPTGTPVTPGARSYLCVICGWIYDPAKGDPDSGIAPGTAWEDIPDDWVCPVCGVGKGDFEPIDTPSPTTAAQSEQDSPLIDQDPIVIIGSGMAGYAVAKEIRKRSPSLPLVIVSADGGEAYSKPMLSNAVARHLQADALVQKDAPTLAAELRAEILTRTRVTSIEPGQRQLTLDDGTGEKTLAYDQLVLALGADARVFPAEGAETVGIATVNDLDDYRRWRERIGAAGRVLLIGAGLIGCEFANDLAGGSFSVDIIDPAPWPLARLLPQEIGTMLTDALQGMDCRFHLGRTVRRYRPAETGFVAELDDGSEVAFDHALSAVGLAPRTQLAQAAGLATGAGIIVDRHLRTSDPYIFALGDCVQTEVGPLPYIAPLLAQAAVIGAILTDTDTPPLHLPALPVVVKTPALPLVVCPPPPGSTGEWDLELLEPGSARAIYRNEICEPLGFALAGEATAQQKELALEMPELLPRISARTFSAASEAPLEDESTLRYECLICEHVYDPALGDPEAGIPPGTPWKSLPDDWICPGCGTYKEDFARID